MDNDQRTATLRAADERATLASFLDHQRDTLAMKCAGLTPGQLRTRALEPSGLSLLGLVRHLAEVERSWFRNVFADEGRSGFWKHPDGTFAEFDVDDADPDEAFAVWRAASATTPGNSSPPHPRWTSWATTARRSTRCAGSSLT